MLQTFRPKSISYSSLHHHEDQEARLGVGYLDLQELLGTSDVIFLCVDGSAKGYFGDEQLGWMKEGALLVDITHPGVIKEEALLAVLEDRHIRAISDHAMSIENFSQLPLDIWFCMNTSSTITEAGVELMSDMATTSLLNILKSGTDQYLVNSEYKNY
jgi:gluconate 2-dehydrogenase